MIFHPHLLIMLIGLPVEKRLCTFCNMQAIENEKHVLLECPFYADIRDVLFSSLSLYVYNFSSLSFDEQISTILGGNVCVRLCAKTCRLILSRRASA